MSGNASRWAVDRLLPLLLLAILPGCFVAGSYDGVAPGGQSQSATSGSHDGNKLLVVIRYPAFYDPAWEDYLDVLYIEHVLVSDPRIPNSPVNPQPFRDALIKTTYYVMEFRDALRARLPDHTVVLQPQRLTMDTGSLSATAAFEMPPTVLYVDFFAYVNPHKFLTGDSNTFGNFISPLISVRTAATAAPATSGALVGTRGLQPKATTAVGHGAAGGLGYTIVDRLRDDGEAGAEVPLPVITQAPLVPGRYLQVPQVNIEMDEARLRAAADAPGGLDPDARPAAAVMASLSEIVLQALDVIDATAAVHDDMARYIERFDAPLAARFASRRTMPGDEPRLALITEFVAVERGFLAGNDDALHDQGYRDGFGDSVRQMLVAEATHYAEWWQQQIIGSLMILGTGLASGGATGNYMPPAIWDAYFQTARSGEELDNAFERHFAGIRARQVDLTIRLAGSDRKIRATNLHELRDELQQLYLEQFPS